MSSVDSRLDSVVKDIIVLSSDSADFKRTLRNIDDKLDVLIRLEVEHAETRKKVDRAFSEIDTVKGQVRVIEIGLPVLKLTSKWVRAGGIGIISGVALYAWALLFVD